MIFVLIVVVSSSSMLCFTQERGAGDGREASNSSPKKPSDVVSDILLFRAANAARLSHCSLEQLVADPPQILSAGPMARS